MPIIGVIDSAKSGNLYNASYESIATVTVSSATSTITISSIPATYEHLQVRVSGRSTGAYTYSSLYLNYNGDTGSNYTYHSLYGDGSSAASTGRGNETAIYAQNIAGANATANNFGALVIDILDYANTNKFKTTRSLGGYDNNGSGTPIGTISLNSGAWRNTVAINSITFATDGNFAVNTRIALYGIKGVI